jgi:hypothetical protein
MKANNLTQVLNIFNPKKPLSTREDLDNYFIERPRGSLREMETYLRAEEETVKILFTGHRGSGKSTELSKLSFLLEDKFFIVNFSIAESLNLYDLSYVDVILVTALKLMQRAHESGVKINELLLQNIFDWLNNEITKEKVIEIPAGANLSANVNLLALKIESKFGGEIVTRTIMRENLEKRLSELMEKINLTIKEIERKKGKRVLIIVEDIDKTDLVRARHLFFEHASSLSKINSKVIYTFPIALRYSNDFQQITRDLKHFVLPNVKIRDRQGNRNDEGYMLLKEVILKRMEENLMTEEALDEIIESSGGLMVDMMRIMQGASIYALSEKKNVIDISHVRRMVNEIRNDYISILQNKHYEILNKIKEDKDKRIVNEETVQEVLHNLSLLEYRNDDIWANVHPIVKPLLIK